MAFVLNVEGFSEGGEIPRRFTCDGGDVSPALHWSGEPEDTRRFALIADDPDAPSGTWNHWLLWDIPGPVSALPEGGAPPKSVPGTNDFRKQGYGGPCPPPGKPHRYYFRLFALDTPSLKLRPGADRAALDKAMQAHVRAKAEYYGRYRRA